MKSDARCFRRISRAAAGARLARDTPLYQSPPARLRRSNAANRNRFPARKSFRPLCLQSLAGSATCPPPALSQLRPIRRSPDMGNARTAPSARLRGCSHRTWRRQARRDRLYCRETRHRVSGVRPARCKRLCRLVEARLRRSDAADQNDCRWLILFRRVARRHLADSAKCSSRLPDQCRSA